MYPLEDHVAVAMQGTHRTARKRRRTLKAFRAIGVTIAWLLAVYTMFHWGPALVAAFAK